MTYIGLARLATAGALVCAAATASTAQAPQKGATVRVHAIVDGNAIVETARRYLGVRYVLGGTTPKAFDCSGFVRYVFRQHGLEMPRTAHEQAALGQAPDGELEPGDLLFFYGGRGAQHIAIYIGQDSIIHASSGAHRVKLDRLSGQGTRRTWFGQRLIAIRRVLPAEGEISLPASIAVEAAAPESEWLDGPWVAPRLIY